MTGSGGTAPKRDKTADLARNYRVTFLRYLAGRHEVALAAAYDLGRQAMSDGVSMLEVVRVHHEVLRSVVRETSPESVDGVLVAAADLLTETLGAADMVQRRLRSFDEGS